MDKQPFVSVVIPTYNREKMLKSCLDSLLTQSYPSEKYELVMVNDGSTDRTEQVLKEYEKKAKCGFKWITQEHQSFTIGTNVGIKNAKGEIICFTGDDCIAIRDWISLLVAGFTDENVGGVGGKVTNLGPPSIIQKYTEETGLLSQERLKSQGAIITGSAAYRKDVLEAIGLFDTQLRSCIDVDVSIRTQLHKFSLKYVPEALIYHHHPSTLKSLLRQQYRNSMGNARLHKKYKKDFSPCYNLALIPMKILYRIFTYPPKSIKSLTAADPVYYLAEPFIDILVFAAHFAGVFKEAFFGKPYTGTVYEQKIWYIQEKSILNILPMFIGKISPASKSAIRPEK